VDVIIASKSHYGDPATHKKRKWIIQQQADSTISGYPILVFYITTCWKWE